MNFLISVGIKKCKVVSLAEIPCAYNDADLVYKTLNEILDTEFSEENSICLKGPTVDEFLAVVKLFKRNLSETDKLIIYFSGHGELIENESLDLLFSNADSDGEGRFRLLRIQEILQQSTFQTIVILDCCHSGAGLNIASNTNIFSNDKISVLASNKPFGRATFDENGSHFTRELCHVLNTVNEEGNNISLRILAEKMESFGHRCYVNTPTGYPNIVLKNSTILIEDNRDFQKRFLMRINESDTTTREMHWYYLMDLPEITKIEVLRNYFEKEVSEPHWLVRRAIGSLISEIRNFKHKESFVLNLLRSTDWMNQCIGLIGARKELDHQSIRDEVKSILKSNTQIDAIWLANLYLSDSNHHDVDEALSSSLSKTPWGVLDIWVRYSEKMDKTILLEMIKSIVDKSLLKPLYLHMFFEDGHIEEGEDLGQAQKSKLIPFLYDLKKRGETKSAKQKWLFSSLYGNWRDQVDLKLRDFFFNTHDDEIRADLELAAELPLVEMRMAIYQYMTIYNELLKDYYHVLKWGLNDPHPWVKRTAIRALKEYSTELKGAFQEEIQGQLYPGKLDFILEAASIGINCDDYIVKHRLNRSEIGSIDWATSNMFMEKRILF